MEKGVARNRTTRRKNPLARVKSRQVPPLSDPREKNDGGRGYQINSVAKALDLLEAICHGEEGSGGAGEELRISQLSRQLGLHKAAVFRLLSTFESRGYVEREQDTGVYRIGMTAYEVGRKLLSRMTLLRLARPVMEELCRRCNEAVYLAVRRGSDFLFIDLVESAQQVKVASLIGKRFPLSSAAPGHLMLAFSGVSNFTSAWSDPFQTMRQQGYCAEHGGMGDLIGCLAAPLFNRAGTMVGALCLVVPSFRMPEQHMEVSLLPPLKDASEAIAAKLGYMKNHAGRVRL